MKFLFSLLILLSSLKVFSSTDDSILRFTDSLLFVTELPLHCDKMYSMPETENDGGDIKGICGDELFWRIVSLRDTAIPYLLNKLSNTTTTEVIVVYYGNYAVADVANEAIKQIIKGIPDVELVYNLKDNGLGEQNRWNFLRQSTGNRKKFQRALSKWYEKNKSSLVWIKDKTPAEGHYEIRQ